MTARPDLELVSTAEVLTDRRLPPVIGFIASDFAPLVYAAVRGCLGDPPSDVLPADGRDRVGIVLGSRRFDTPALELSVAQVERGRVNPLLFYQAVPTAVLGQVARDYRLTGPVSCLAVAGDARAEVRELARVLLADGDVDQVLALTVELDPDSAKSSAGAELVRRAARSTEPGAAS